MLYEFLTTGLQWNSQINKVLENLRKMDFYSEDLAMAAEGLRNNSFSGVKQIWV